MRDELAPIFGRRTVAEWISALVTAGVPCAMVNDMSQVFQDEQVRALGLLRTIDAGSGEVIQTVGVPVEFSASAQQPLRPPPRLGEHSAEVLRSLGYSTHDIDAGIDAGWLVTE